MEKIDRLRRLDIWRLGTSYRIVVSDGADSNKCNIISAGTGEAKGPLAPKEAYEYLALGKNELGVKFEHHANLKDLLMEVLPEGFGLHFPYYCMYDPKDEARGMVEEKEREEKENG